MRRPAVLVLLTATSLLMFGALVMMTGFVACGISGCSGGGFGPAFSPGPAQVWLLAAALTWLPLGLVLLPAGPPRLRVGFLSAVLTCAALATVVLTGVGPNGCPLGQHRATAGPDAFQPGAATCSGDDDALPPAGSPNQ